MPSIATILESLGTAVREAAAIAAPSVVTIGRTGRGSGWVIATDRVVTSAHNLRDETVAVAFADGRTEQGRVVGVDADGDLAVVDVPTAGVAALDFADELPSVGDPVIAAARGGHRSRLTVGFVSATDEAFVGPRGRPVRGSLEHTAPLARGSSGGPILDAGGRVVGINTHRAGDGFYLARPADDALRTRIAELAAGRSVRSRTLGIAVAPAKLARQLREAVGLDARDGVLIRAVAEGGVGAAAGLAAGDLVVVLDGRPIASIADLQQALDALTGDTASVTVVRGATEHTLTLTFPPTDAG